MSMHYERSNKRAPTLPLCSRCAQSMGLARITQRFENLSELHTFECLPCGMLHIEERYRDLSPPEQIAKADNSPARRFSPAHK